MPATRSATDKSSVEGGGGFRNGYYYRGRMEQSVSGPYAAVVRECLLTPNAIGWGDYLGRVEVVMDLSRAFARAAA